MTASHWVVMNSLKGVTRLLCRVEYTRLQAVPDHGPLIMVCNHINFIEAPVMYTHLMPRPVTTMAKVETWDNRWIGGLFDLVEAIPVERGTADLSAIHAGLEALEKGKILVITPEGSRSGDGRLQKGQPGVVTLALHSGAPLLPVVYYGNEALHHNIRRLRRTNFHIRVGQPFRLDAHSKTVTRPVRQQMVDEIMFQMAALLPPQYRGAYAELGQMTREYIASD
jgi:1-acyl-sn-glycerol-3-phosphate acyltransferase